MRFKASYTLIKYILPVLFTTISLTGCIFLSDSYKKENGNVYYLSGSASNGMDFSVYKTEVTGADYSTFVDLKGCTLGKDKKHVFLRGKIYEGPDPSSFEFLGDYYAKDKNYSYVVYDDTMLIIEGVNVKSFVSIGNHLAKDESYIIDGQGKMKPYDIKSFKLIKDVWAKDNYYYYYNYNYKGFERLDFVDYSSFKTLSDEYATDKNNVYYFNKYARDDQYVKDENAVVIIKGADSKTFHLIKRRNLGTDKSGNHWFNGEKLPEEKGK